MKTLLHSTLLLSCLFGSLHAMDEAVEKKTQSVKGLLMACAKNRTVYDAAESKLKELSLELEGLKKRDKDKGRFEARNYKHGLIEHTTQLLSNQLNDTRRSLPFFDPPLSFYETDKSVYPYDDFNYFTNHPSYGECYYGDRKECQRFIDDLRARNDKACASQLAELSNRQ